MPKISTYPDCFDETKTITIACLKRLGYLKSGVIVRGASLHWTRGGRPNGWINLDVDAVNGSMELRYNVKQPSDTSARSIEYCVKLESRISNLGKGLVWYFICPATGMRCRTLYGIGDYFLSRAAYPTAMYSGQTESKRYRNFSKAFVCLDLRRDFLNKRHARTTYKGRLTKRYRRILEKEGRFNPNAIRQFLAR
ncbi:MAG: hypothetical protein ABI539_13355 [Acidobacteriota bacterium]